MASFAPSESVLRLCRRLGFCLLLTWTTFAIAQGQTVTYRLHKETSGSLFQLKTANPDATSVAIQSANLKNVATGDYVVKEFETLSGVPNASGVITSGSTISVTLWMKKTASAGTMFPRVKIHLNTSGGTSVAVVTGTTALTTTLTQLTLTGAVPSNVSMTTSDRFYVWVGVNLTAQTSSNNRGELNIEGTVNGNYDSKITLPLPVPPPSISNLSPNAGAVGDPVIVAGSNFSATQGTSTIKFNGVTATPTSWSATSISVPVPAGATTGLVEVTVNGLASNGVSFTVKPKINDASLTTGIVGTSVTITGTSFGASQGSSTITFNSTATTPTAWSDSSISAPVPSGATTGAVVVTVNGQSSNGVTFTVITTGSLTGTITRASDGAPINGALIEAVQSGVVEGSSLSTADGSYTISSIDAGTYDVHVSNTGYETGIQNGVVINAGSSTTVNKTLNATSAQDIHYVHDELGRLVGVVTASEAATYSYDEVGNLSSISRGSSTQVSLIEFTPNGTGVGGEVTIFGTAFKNSPSQNTVKFNGVTAIVTFSGPTKIVTRVPVGATTGPISVTTSSGTGVSSTPFIVGNLHPTISSFSPASGGVGTSVVINGSNFDSLFYNNKVKFHLSHSHVSASTSTSITTAVPAGATSGPITVLAPEGSITTTDDFFVAPTGHAGSDIEVTGRVSIGDVRPITISSPGKIALLVFDGVIGQRLNMGLSGITLGSPCCTNVAGTTIYKPDGSTLFSAGFLQEGLGTPTLVLPATGTYTILIDPAVNNTGNITVTLSEELGASISIDGPVLQLNFTKGGQNARLVFSGSAGQRVNLGLSGITLGNPCCTNVASAAILKPDGTPLLSPVGFIQEGIGTATLELPVTGIYSITVDPVLALTGNVTVTLSTELEPPISIDGSVVTLNFTRGGQNARLMFSGTAGQRVSLGLSGITLGNPCCTPVAGVAIYKPDGTALLSPVGFIQDGVGTATLELPVTGTYTITVDPALTLTGNVIVTLSSEITTPITIDGPVVPLNFARVGQNARLPFDGTAGQRVSLGLNGITLGNVCCGVVAVVAIYKPDGTALLSPVGLEPNIGLGTALLELPVTGTYLLSIDPVKAHTGSVTPALSTELTTAIAINGPAVPLDFSRPGQNARLSFNGTAGQLVSVGLTDVTLASGCCFFDGQVGIYKPDGIALLSPTNFKSGYGSATFVLPVTGSYTIPIDPAGMNTGNVAVLLSEDVAAPITINGPNVPVNLSRLNQNASLTFNGTSGSQVTVRITGNPFGSMTVKVIKPDGTTLISHNGFNTSFNLPAQTLPASGVYRINIDPSTWVILGTVTVGVTNP